MWYIFPACGLLVCVSCGGHVPAYVWVCVVSLSERLRAYVRKQVHANIFLNVPLHVYARVYGCRDIFVFVLTHHTVMTGVFERFLQVHLLFFMALYITCNHPMPSCLLTQVPRMQPPTYRPSTTYATAHVPPKYHVCTYFIFRASSCVLVLNLERTNMTFVHAQVSTFMSMCAHF